jgi:multiple sugar transport system permease protein
VSAVRRTDTRRRLLGYTALAAVALAFGLPFASMVATSLLPESAVLDPSGALIPDLGGAHVGEDFVRLVESAAHNYTAVLASDTADFPTYLRNSLAVALLSATLVTISSAIVAFGFARLSWPGREAAYALVLATLLVPFTVVMAPQYLLFAKLGLIGTLLPLWLPSAFGGAFGIHLLRQAMEQVPTSLDEAARIDGCGHVSVFLRVVVPSCVPALAAVFLLQFTAAWNDFIGPLVFLNHQEQYTLALGLVMYQSQHGGTPWSLLMAASVLTMAPVLVVFVLAQRAFTSSVLTRGLKG